MINNEKSNSNFLKLLGLCYLAIHQISVRPYRITSLMTTLISAISSVAFILIKYTETSLQISTYVVQLNLYKVLDPIILTILVMGIFCALFMLYTTYIIQNNIEKGEVQDNLLTIITKSSLISQIVFQLIVTLSKLIFQILYLPLLYAILLLNYQENNVRLVLYIVSLVLISLIYLAHLIFIDESIDFIQNPYQRLNNSISYYLILFLGIIQAVCATLLYKSDVIYFLFIFQAFQQLMIYYDTKYNLPYTDHAQLIALTIGQSFSIMILTSVIVQEIFSVYFDYGQCVIIVTPILVMVIYTDISKTMHKIILSDEGLIEQLNFQIVYILRSNNARFWTYRALLFGKHRNSCLRPHCNCKSQESFDLFNPVKNPFFHYIKRNLVVNFGNNILLQDQSELKYFHHYLIALNELGYTTQAFQQISFIKTNESAQRPIKSLNGSMMNTNTTESKLQRMGNTQTRRIESSSSHQVNQEHQDDEITNKNPIQMSLIDQCRFEIVQQIIKQNMSFNIGKNSPEQNYNQHLIQVFLQAENSNLWITNSLVQLMKGKIQYLKDFWKISDDLLYDNVSRINHKLFILHRKLQRKYDHFPSHKLQLTLSFLQAELMNNYFLAYKTSNIMSIKDELKFKDIQQSSLNFLSKDVTYMNVIYQSNQFLQISDFSPNTPKFFGYKLEEFKKIEDIEQLMPQTISQIHRLFVSEFLQSGQSKYFSSTQQAYSLNKQGYMESIEMLYDINYTDSNNFTFIIFLNKVQPESLLFVNQEGLIGGVTQNLFSRFGLSLAIKEDYTTFYKLKIETIIPDFFEQIQLSQSNPYNDMMTLRSHFMIQKENVKIGIPIIQNKICLRLDTYSALSTAQMVSYNSVIRVNIKNIKGRIYYSIAILDMKANQNQTQVQFDDIDSFSDQSSQSPNRPHSLMLKDKIIQKDSDFGKIKSEQWRQIEGTAPILGDLTSRVEINDNEIYNALISQNRIINSSHTLARIGQQQYFADIEKEQMSSVVQNIEQSSGNIMSYMPNQQAQIDQELLKDVMLNFQQDIEEEELQIKQMKNDQQSQIQSVSAFKSSKYFYKYTTFNRLTQEPFQIAEFQIAFFFLILFIFIGLGCTVMHYLLTQADIENLQEQLRLVKIRKLVMSPSSKSIVSQIIISEYTSLLDDAIIDQDLYDQISLYSMARILDNFDTLKSNLLGAIDDPYLSSFFDGLMTEIYTADEDTLEPQINNGTFRTKLIQYVSSQESATKSLLLNINYPTLNWKYYGFANYATLFDLMEPLSHQILEHAQQVANDINNKTIRLTVAFVILAVVSILCSLIFYIQVIIFYERLLQLRMFIQKEYLQKELDRLVLLLSIIEKDRNILYNYNFDLSQKEQYLTYIEKQNRPQDKYVKQVIILTKSRIIVVTMHLMILCLFLAFHIGQSLTQSNYLVEFIPTSNHLFDTSEIVSIVNSAYVVKELAYVTTLDTYNYLGPTADDDYKAIVKLCIDHFTEFLGWAYDISTLEILNGDHFKREFLYYSGNNLCQIFDDQYRATADYICKNSLNGDLLLGMIPSIIYIQRQFIQELEEGFTGRKQYPINEIEGALVFADCLDSLSEILYEDVNAYTDQFQITKHVVSSIHLVYLTFFFIILILILKKYAMKQSYLQRQFLTLAPIYTIVLENQFERAIRLFAIKQDWL